MPAVRRREQVLEVIRNKSFVSIPDLVDQLGVSESTVRRDLNSLEKEGTAKRTHGGVLYTGPSPKLHHFDRIQSYNWGKKKQIAHLAQQFVDDGDTILLDGGSTTYELARLLVGRAVTIITNSLPVANLFSTSDPTELIFVGGAVHHKTGVCLGNYSVQMLQSVNCRRAFLSVSGVHDDGLYNNNALLVETEQAMMKSADEVFIVADSTKFGRKSLAKLCEFDQINTMIVDNELDPTWKNTISGHKVNVVTEIRSS